MLRTSYGCAVGVINKGAVATQLDQLTAIGVEWIEPQFTGPDAFDAEDDKFIAESRKQITDAGLKVWSIHAPFGSDIDISSTDEQILERGVAAINRTVRGCAGLGGKIVVIHISDGSCPPGEDRTERIENAQRSVERIAEVAKEHGVQIAVENLLPNHLADSVAIVRSIVEMHPTDVVGICLDSGHVNVNAAGDAKKAAVIANGLADRIITTHLHDNDGKGDLHQVPGLGNVDWSVMGKAIAASPFDAPLMFELSVPEPIEETLSKLPAALEMIRSHL